MNYVYSRYMLLQRSIKVGLFVIDGGLRVEPVYLIPPSSLWLQPPPRVRSAPRSIHLPVSNFDQMPPANGRYCIPLGAARNRRGANREPLTLPPICGSTRS